MVPVMVLVKMRPWMPWSTPAVKVMHICITRGVLKALTMSAAMNGAANGLSEQIPSPSGSKMELLAHDHQLVTTSVSPSFGGLSLRHKQAHNRQRKKRTAMVDAETLW
jgi:hypothetical protein